MSFEPIGGAGVRIVPEFEGFEAAVVEAATAAAEAASAAIKKTFAAAFKETTPAAVESGNASASAFTAAFSKSLAGIETQAKAVFASITAQAKAASAQIASASSGVGSTGSRTTIGSSGTQAATAATQEFGAATAEANIQLALFASEATAAEAQLAIFADTTVATLTPLPAEIAAVTEGFTLLGGAAGLANANLSVLDTAFGLFDAESQSVIAAALAEGSAFNALSGEALILANTLNVLEAGLARIPAEAEAGAVSARSLQTSLGGFARLAPVVAGVFAVKEVADFGRAADSVSAIFGNLSDEVTKFVDKLNPALGLSKVAAERLASSVGQAVTNLFGVNEASEKITETIVDRSANVAAATGKSVEAVSQAITTAIQGQTKGLKTLLGIDISPLDQKLAAINLGFGDQVGKLSDAQKAAVIYEAILEKTDRFADQAAKTQDTLAGQFRQVKAAAGDAALTLGTALAPATEAVLKTINQLLGVFEALPSPLRSAIANFGLLVLAIGPATKAIGFLVEGFAALKTAALVNVIPASEAITVLGGSFAGLQGAIGASAGLGPFALAAGAALIAVNLLDDGTKQLGKDIDALAGVSSDTKLLDDFLSAADKKINSFGGTVKEFFRQLNPFGGTEDQAAEDLRVQKSALDKLFASPGGPAVSQRLVTEAEKEGIPTAAGLRQEYEKLAAAAKERAKNVKDSADAASEAAKADETAAASAAKLAQIATTNINGLISAQSALQSAQAASDTADKNVTKTKDALAKAQDNYNKVFLQVKADDIQAIADATEKLAEADQHVADTAKAAADARAVLNELTANESVARERELSDATDGVTSAQIAYARAVRARIAAEEALKKTGGSLLNLQGKTVAQIREILANARANAQAASQTASNAGKDPQVLQENVIEATIAERAAKEHLDDAEKTLSDTQGGRVGILKEIVNQQAEVNRLDTEAHKALVDQAKDVAALNKAKAADPDLDPKVLAAKEAIATADERKAAALDAQVKAGDKLKGAKAEEISSEDTLAGKTNATAEAILAKVGANDKLIAQIRNSPELAAAFLANLSNIPGVGNLGPAIGPPTPDEQKNRDALNAILRKFGFPTLFAQGGIANQATLGIFGEAGREGLIPFTKPARAAELLAGDPAWAAIQAHIDRITLPSRSPLAATLNLPSPSGRGGVATGPGVDDLLDALKRIEKKLDKAGITVERGAVTIEQQKGEDATLVARRAVQSLERRLGRGH